MAKKFLSLPLSPKLLETLNRNARDLGESPERYAVHLIKENVAVDPSFTQKTTVGQKVSGQSIIDHGKRVLLNGSYYDYRLQNQLYDNQKPAINRDAVYQVVRAEGHVLVLHTL